jgi:hypothetical protein
VVKDAVVPVTAAEVIATFAAAVGAAVEVGATPVLPCNSGISGTLENSLGNFIVLIRDIC